MLSQYSGADQSCVMDFDEVFAAQSLRLIAPRECCRELYLKNIHRHAQSWRLIASLASQTNRLIEVGEHEVNCIISIVVQVIINIIIVDYIINDCWRRS